MWDRFEKREALRKTTMPDNWNLFNPRALGGKRSVDHHIWANQCFIWDAIAVTSNLYEEFQELLNEHNISKDNDVNEIFKISFSLLLDQFASNTLTRNSLQMSRLTGRQARVPEGLDTDTYKRHRPVFDPVEEATRFSKKKKLEEISYSSYKDKRAYNNNNNNQSGYRGGRRQNYQGRQQSKPYYRQDNRQDNRPYQPPRNNNGQTTTNTKL
eukprot:TRINITY_DN6142_c0_g1_i2.p1 TRINITY_DN6142_c0_g1~~TRINITY_DN6142_c0_g1_i2.p1  ORF type:complete len:212 (-),score=31.01 TRINITY_DN6142_c0_g1_i2:177-812(-)